MKLITVFGLALALCASSAQAALITLDLSGGFNFGGNLGGTITLDQVTGNVTAVDLTVNAPYNYTFTVFNDQGCASFLCYVDVSLMGAAQDSYPLLSLDFAVSTLVGYAGGQLCGAYAPCNTNASGLSPSLGTGVQLYSGVATVDSSSIPEPAPLALLAMGIAGLLAVSYRRTITSRRWSRVRKNFTD